MDAKEEITKAYISETTKRTIALLIMCFLAPVLLFGAPIIPALERYIAKILSSSQRLAITGICLLGLVLSGTYIYYLHTKNKTSSTRPSRIVILAGISICVSALAFYLSQEFIMIGGLCFSYLLCIFAVILYIYKKVKSDIAAARLGSQITGQQIPAVVPISTADSSSKAIADLIRPPASPHPISPVAEETVNRTPVNMIPFSGRNFREYTEDVFHGIIWRWQYKPGFGDKPRGITPHCSNCQEEAVLEINQQQPNKFRCPYCLIIYTAPTSLDSAFESIGNQIQAKIQDRSWIDIVDNRRAQRGY